MYLVAKDGRAHFLNFLRNLGAQAILLTAFSIVVVMLKSATDGAEQYVFTTLLFLTLITLFSAAYANIAEFSYHAFHKDRRSKTGKSRFFVESMIALLVMMASYFAVLIAVGATFNNINIR